MSTPFIWGGGKGRLLQEWRLSDNSVLCGKREEQDE